MIISVSRYQLTSNSAHILFVQSSSDLYGSDRCLINIASGLARKGYRVSVVLPYEGPLIDELEAVGIITWIQDPVVIRKQVLSGPAGSARFLIKAPSSVHALGRIMRREGVDLVHSNTGVVLGGALAARRCNLPHVWHFREIFSEYKTAWRLYEPLVAHYSNRILCISEAVRSQFQLTASLGKTSIVYDGTSMATVGDDEARRRLDSVGSPFRIVCSGRINPPIKGQDVLVEATRILVGRGIPVETAIIGDVFPGREALRVGLEEQVAASGLGDAVRITGFQEDIVAWIDGADLIVVPSRHPEGFGIVILEAFARAKPVIGSRIGGIPEIIRDGENGLLVPPGDSAALAEAIINLYHDSMLRKRLALAGRRTLEDHFSSDSAVERLAVIYEETLASKRE